MLINLIVEIILQCICILNIKLYTLNSKEMGRILQDGKKNWLHCLQKKKNKEVMCMSHILTEKDHVKK